MNHETDDERTMEEQVRDMLADDAYTIHPSPAPWPAIRRRGVAERRKRAAVAGAVLAALGVVPAAAYAVAGGDGGRGGGTAAPMASVSTPHSRTPATPALSPSGGQLLDGVTSGQAADGLEKCLAYDRAKSSDSLARSYIGVARDYRILLAMRSTGDGFHVVAVKAKTDVRLICTIEDGKVSDLNVSGPENSPTGTVVSDINGSKLYRQSSLDKGHWKLPFRWGVIGTVEPSVAKVTVSYGDSDATATLDGHWFVAAGVLTEQVTQAPHIKGFDTAGKLVYDSDTDERYHRIRR
ncbi:hypothetical protein [Streptomyces cellulosae]|uniref:hypothetical protein n=1 Tax=Streptomyces cellulosae TaxID=1968 RepID=UPI0004C9113F|nr:hypothetical protein [Streptomyces cellulosae]